MLDRKFIVENADAVKQNCANRNVTADVDRLVELETKRRDLMKAAEEFNRQANEVSKSIGKAKDEAEREQRKEQGRELRQKKDDEYNCNGGRGHQPLVSGHLRLLILIFSLAVKCNGQYSLGSLSSKNTWSLTTWGHLPPTLGTWPESLQKS